MLGLKGPDRTNHIVIYPSLNRTMIGLKDAGPENRTGQDGSLNRTNLG